MSDFNDMISRTVTLWLEGYTHVEYAYDMNYADRDNFLTQSMDEIKIHFYDLILNELKKQTKLDEIVLIETKLGGKLQVFFDESGIIGCIIHKNYYNEKKSDSSDSYDLDDYDD